MEMNTNSLSLSHLIIFEEKLRKQTSLKLRSKRKIKKMNSKRRRASTTSFREKDLSEINTENFLEFLDLKCLLENFKTQRTFYRFSKPKIPPQSLWDIKDLYEFFRTWKII